jgi:hypothetical protein
MSNHNLFIHGADGAAQPATTEQILAAARQALAHRVRRGASLDSPQKVREYLTVRLGHLNHEIFGVILVDLCGVGSYVDGLTTPAEISLIFRFLLNITTARVHGVGPHFPRILGAHHAYSDFPSLLFD